MAEAPSSDPGREARPGAGWPWMWGTTVGLPGTPKQHALKPARAPTYLLGVSSPTPGHICAFGAGQHIPVCVLQ